MSDSLWPYGTVALQALLSMGFSRQEYWSGLSFPPPGDLPNPGIKPASLMSPALAGRFLPLTPPGKPIPFHPFYSTESYSVLCGDLSGKEIQKKRIYGCIWASQVALVVKNPPANCQHRRHKRRGFDPWVGKIPWRRARNPLQDSCLENPMDRGTWWSTVHGVTESDMTEVT